MLRVENVWQLKVKVKISYQAIGAPNGPIARVTNSGERGLYLRGLAPADADTCNCNLQSPISLGSTNSRARTPALLLGVRHSTTCAITS